MSAKKKMIACQVGFYKLVQLDQHIVKGEKTGLYWVTTIARHIVDEDQLEQLKADCY